MSAQGPEATGYDIPTVERWIGENLEDLRPPFTWTRLEGGHSNLTYQLRDALGAEAVIRRPPTGELQAGAHDMHREFRIISALWPTEVPVARPFCECQDPTVTGANFYVMGFVDGRPLDSTQRIQQWLSTAELQLRCSESFIDVLALLHMLDPDDIGLETLGRHDDYAGRQLRAWYRSWTTSIADSSYDDRRVHEIHDQLDTRKPDTSTASLVHGDFGLHNCIVGHDGTIAAVVDWEVATLGDPLSDLAYVINRWSVEGEELPGREGITQPAGFLKRTQVIDRYKTKTNADLSRLDYFIALNFWRSACIMQGVYTRYVRGQKSTEGVDLTSIRESIGIRIDQAEAATSAL